MLGYIHAGTTGETDALLAEVAKALQARGVKVAGALEQRGAPASDGRLHMELRLLPQGDICRISQDLGPSAKGCRLDASGLAQAAGQVARGLDASPDLLIVNKFGKTEADGGGFRDVIGQSLSQGVPVLLSVGTGGAEAFAQFAADLGTELPSRTDAILDWVSSQIA